MKTEIQRFDATDEEGKIHTVVELHEEMSGRTSYANVSRVDLYVAFCTLGGELLCPMGSGRYRIIGGNRVLSRMKVPPPLHTSGLQH